jgi:hypothetical protein
VLAHDSALSLKPQTETARNNPAVQFSRFDTCRQDNAKPPFCISPRQWSRGLQIVDGSP